MTAATGEDPKVLANYRFARGAVIILSALIVVAIGVLVWGFATRGGGKQAAATGAAEVRNVTLPNGSHIVSVDVQQDRLIVRTRAYDGEEIDIIDTHDGRLIGRVSVPPANEEKRSK